MENPGKETYVEQMERVNKTNPFMLHNRIRAVALSEDRAEVRAEITEDSLNAMQTVHGGLMFVMAEVAAGLVTRNDGRKYVTLDSSFRFLRGSSAKNIQGLAKITKRGKTVCFTPIRGSSWQKENLRFIVWVNKNRNSGGHSGHKAFTSGSLGGTIEASTQRRKIDVSYLGKDF